MSSRGDPSDVIANNNGIGGPAGAFSWTALVKRNGTLPLSEDELATQQETRAPSLSGRALTTRYFQTDEWGL